MPTPAKLALDPEREHEDLREYLGDAYDLGKLQQYQKTLDAEFDACGDEESFYRTSEGYLYNLTAFAMTGTKLPYLEALTARVPPGSRMLDYGCGIGSDGLLLLEAGYRVEFADFDNPSTEFLRWRLERRGFDAPVHDLDDHVPEGFDASYAFDVIEHVPDPFDFLAQMEARSRLVMVNLLEPHADEQDLHHELPIGELVRHAGHQGLAFYRIMHGSSHVLLYRSEPAGAVGRAVSYGRYVSARALRRLGLPRTNIARPGEGG